METDLDRLRLHLVRLPLAYVELDAHHRVQGCVLEVVGVPLREGRRQVEYRIVRPDGAVRWIRDRAFPVRHDAGETYRVVGIGEDITEQKLAEEKWLRSNKRVQALSHRLLAVREEERGRLARELQDGISQTLTSLAFQFHAPLSFRERGWG